jgi:DNA-binding LytR/AlgR family response regulator
MRILIIENEPPAARNLVSILDKLIENKTLTILESIAETLEWFAENRNPDLIFLDIHLADGYAFEIFNHTKITCPVIFTTAYDEYALQAFKVNSIDYLLKPITAEAVKKALDKLEQLLIQVPSLVRLKELIPQFQRREYRRSFLVHHKGDKLIPLKVDDFAAFYIENGIVRVITTLGQTYIIDQTLEELEVMLNPADFFRANRQTIISRDAVSDIDLWFNGRLSVNLKIKLPDKIFISKAKAPEFKEWFTV